MSRRSIHAICVMHAPGLIGHCAKSGSRRACGVRASVVVIHGLSRARKDVWALDYIDLLRRLAVNDARIIDELGCTAGVDGDASEPDSVLDPRTLALVRLAALVAVGGAVPSYGAQADAAVGAGASAAEIVDVLVGVVPVVGIPCVVAAAPKLALALGCDTDDALVQFSGG